MSLQDWSALAALIVTAMAGVAAGMKFMVKHYLAELKPNGGGSMNDRLVRVEAMLEILLKGE